MALLVCILKKYIKNNNTLDLTFAFHILRIVFEKFQMIFILN